MFLQTLFTLHLLLKRAFRDVILLSDVKFWFNVVFILNREREIFHSLYIFFKNNFWICHNYWKDNLHNIVCLTDWKRRWVLDFVLYRWFNSPNVSTVSECAKDGKQPIRDIGISVVLLRSNVFTVIIYYSYMIILKCLS